MKKHLLPLGVCLVTILLTTMAIAQTPAAPPAPTVVAASAGSQMKIDGRLFVGLFDSGKQGAIPNRSIDIPDAKLRFTYMPSKDITIVNRFSNTRATNAGFDYFYADLNNWAGALPGHTLRVGKMKEDIGEETWTDNPMESILLTNSAAAVGGYDGGVDFRGPIPVVGVPTTYSVSVLNNIGGPGVATRALGTGAKIGTSPIANLYISGSYFTSGDLINAAGAVVAPALKIANLQTVPAGATAWKRTLWEGDVRWNYGRTGIKPEIPSSATPVPFQVAAAYGQSKDDFTGAPADRKANYWYVEGQYNVNPKVYLASRYSEVKLNGGATDKLVDSPVAVNAYKRFSLGGGYHLSALTDLKAELTSNTTSGGATKPKLNQVAVGIATKF